MRRLAQCSVMEKDGRWDHMASQPVSELDGDCRMKFVMGCTGRELNKRINRHPSSGTEEYCIRLVKPAGAQIGESRFDAPQMESKTLQFGDHFIELDLSPVKWSERKFEVKADGFLQQLLGSLEDLVLETLRVDLDH